MSKQKIGTIETPRLILRPLQASDVEALQAIGTDEVFAMVPEIESPFDAAAWVKRKTESEDQTLGHVIITKQTQDVVGYIQISTVVTQEGAHLTAGYWLGQEYWGHGYATEALGTALEALQATVTEGKQLIPLHAQALPENTASQRVLQKCGFVRSDPPNGAPSVGDAVWYHWPPSATRFHGRRAAERSR